jgi:hypothetical protein
VSIGTAPSTGIDRQEVNVAGCLFENSVGKASEERGALLCAGVRGERPRREGDPREEFGGETVCIKQQMGNNNCYRRRGGRVIVSESCRLPKVLNSNVWERALKLCTELSCCLVASAWEYEYIFAEFCGKPPFHLCGNTFSCSFYFNSTFLAHYTP